MSKSKWNINSTKLRWIKGHDWFIKSEGCDATGFCVLCRDYEDNDPNKPIVVRFTDFHELLAWAGY